jgi:hypothetical protein
MCDLLVMIYEESCSQVIRVFHRELRVLCSIVHYQNRLIVVWRACMCDGAHGSDI